VGGVNRFAPREDLPLPALPRWARDYVEGLAHVLQVDPTVVALTVFGALAIGVQGKAELAVRGGWVEPLSFWTLTALRSGNRKTPALLRPLAPLRSHERAANEARDEYRRRLRAHADAISPSAADRKRRAQELADAEPPARELFGGDLTPEAIALALAEQHESYAVVTDEPTSLALVLGGLYSEGHANTGVFMAGYSGSPYRRRRVKSPGARLERPSLSLVLVGQPSVFEDLTSRENLIELGFVGRLLVARPRDLLGERAVHSDGIDPEVEAAYSHELRTILAAPDMEPLPDVRSGWEGDPPAWPKGPRPRHRLELTPEARALHLDAEAEIEPLLAESEVLGNLSDFGAKLSGLIARVAGLLHVAHHTETWWRDPVGVEVMGWAVEVGRYALGQVLALWSEGAQERREAILADHVLERGRKLVSNGAGLLTWRALSRSLVQGNGRGRIRSSEDLRRLVDQLVERGDLIPDRTSTRGERWVLADHELGAGRRYAAQEEL